VHGYAYAVSFIDNPTNASTISNILIKVLMVRPTLPDAIQSFDKYRVLAIPVTVLIFISIFCREML
jgi:hypothetical protein